MGKVVRVHEYELKPGVQAADFERALRDAERRGLFDLPGLSGHHFLRGLKGSRRGRYAAVWIFDRREAWERLSGRRTRNARRRSIRRSGKSGRTRS